MLFGGRTGDQALLSFGNLGSAANGNNDWLISPELSGKAQTITFYVKAPQCDNANYGAEDFYVAYSTTDKASNHFTKIYSEKASDNVNWAKHTVDLPEGAKYFSIVHTSTVPVNPTGFEPAGFMVDDVTYESAPLQIVGYNVYRNTSLVANKTTDLSFVDAEVGRLVGDQRSVAIDVVTNDLERSTLVGHVIDHEASRLEASRVHRHRRGVDDREVLGTLGQIDRVLSPVHVVRSLLAIDLREVVGSLVRRRVGDIEVLGAIVGVVTLRSLDVERDGLSLARELRRNEPVVVAVGGATEVTEAQREPGRPCGHRRAP